MMVSKRLSGFILLFVTSATCVTDIGINEPCKIQHLDGICVPFASCKFAMTLLSINDVQFLRTMLCGFEGTIPKVCCPIPDKYDKTTTERQATVRTTLRTTTDPYKYKIDDFQNVTPPPVAPPRRPVEPRARLPGRDVCGQITDSDRIYGGNIADIDEFPWLVRIKFAVPTRRREEFACSGTLISDRYVLTAAHCFTIYKVVGVRLGEWDTETDVDCQDGFCNDLPMDLKVKKVIVYPGYNRKNLTSGDIALLELEHSVNFTDFVKPVCLPTTEYIARQDYIDSTYTTAGWGKTEFGQPSVLKRKVNLDSVAYSICSSAIPKLPKIEDPSVICAGGRQGKDTCQGDSGGPLLRVVGENFQQNWYVYGITSYGVACGTAGKPGIYTRVSKYMDWILENIT